MIIKVTLTQLNQVDCATYMLRVLIFFFKFSKALFICWLISSLSIYLPFNVLILLYFGMIVAIAFSANWNSAKPQNRELKQNVYTHIFLDRCPFNEIGPWFNAIYWFQYRYIEHEHTHNVTDLLIADKCHQFYWNDVAIGVHCYICRKSKLAQTIFYTTDVARFACALNRNKSVLSTQNVTIRKRLHFFVKFNRICGIPYNRKWLINRSIVHCVVVNTRFCTNK